MKEKYVAVSAVKDAMCKLCRDMRYEDCEFPDICAVMPRIDNIPAAFEDAQVGPVPKFGVMMEWIPVESRPMDEEERRYYSEQYGYDIPKEEAIIYCSQLPEDGQEVLVCNTYGQIWIDTFDNDPDYGVGFETNGDMEGIVAWMPLPSAPKIEKEEVTDPS